MAALTSKGIVRAADISESTTCWHGKIDSSGGSMAGNSLFTTIVNLQA